MAEIIDVNDPHDPRIAAFRDVRERDLTGRDGFIAEGTVVVAQLLEADRFTPSSLLVLRNRLGGIGDLLRAVPDGVPVFVAERDVFDAIAGFPVHRGVLAHGRRIAAEPDALPRTIAGVARAGQAVVVAVGIANHDNMGAIFRNAQAFGAGLVLVDSGSCDPLYRKAIRVSAGSVLKLPFERIATASEALTLLSVAGFRSLGLSPRGRLALETIDAARPSALFLGAEGPGLADDLMAEMDTLRIEMTPGFDSLNVATAGAIVLQRLYSARLARGR